MTTLTTLNAASAASYPPDSAPSAPREPKPLNLHGDHRVDDYFWLRNRDDPRTLPYLRAENAHTEAWFAPHAALQEKLYQEMLGRIQQDDSEVPYRFGDWWYASRTLDGKQYPVYTRRRAAGPDRHEDPAAKEDVLLDLNELAHGKSFFALGAKTVSPNGEWLAYSTDERGSREYTLHVKNLVTGETLPYEVPGVDSVEWGNDNRTLYYVTIDAAKRADKLWRQDIAAHIAQQKAGTAVLMDEEKDAQFELSLDKTRDQRYIVLSTASKDSNDVRILDASRPGRQLRVVLPRRPNVQYALDHRAGQFYLRINDKARDFRVVRVDARKPDLAHAEELVPARSGVMIDGADVFARHLVLTERVAGVLQLRIVDLIKGGEHTVAFDEAAHSVGLGTNAEFDTTRLRFEYTSLATPNSVYDYDMTTRERTLRKRQPVRGGYDPSLYASERLTAHAADGTDVPISIVYRRDLRREGPQPLLLYGYGSYGIPSDPWFSSARLSLLDRGAIFAIAHIRGGGDLGRSWYEAGKMAKKMNTFTDFIACAEALIKARYTEPAKLAIQGGSAGGLLVTAATNLRPDLFTAVIADVPFVDVISTMEDETLPLTTGEFAEWGNPKNDQQYAWMRAYSPYDNLKGGAYPAMFVRTGLNDQQVSYWEPSKYVAKLRTLKTDSNPLLLRVDLDLGHGGSSGRFDALREVAQEYVFLLERWGVGH